MKVNKKTVAAVAAILILSTYSVTASAVMTDGAGLKKGLLLSSGEDMSRYDTNGDSRVNVLDMCRYKADLIRGGAASEAKIRVGSAYSESDGSKVYVPVIADISGEGISAVQMDVSCDRRYFTLSGVRRADLGGTVSFSAGSTRVQFLSDGGRNITGSGSLFILEFDTEGSVPNDNYEFYMYNISGTVKTSQTDQRELNSDECAEDTDIYRYYFGRTEVKVTTPVTSVTEAQYTTAETTVTSVTTAARTETSAYTETTAAQTGSVSSPMKFSMQTALVSSDGGRLSVPVYVADNSHGFSSFSMKVSYDTSVFALVGVRNGVYGGYGYVTGNRDTAVFYANNSQNINKDGCVAYLDFDIKNASGSYEFSASEIKALSTEPDWSQYTLNDAECTPYSEVYRFDSSSIVTTTVTTTVTTRPAVTTAATTTTKAAVTQPPVTTVAAGSSVDAQKSEIAKAVNAKRADLGLKPLSLDSKLCQAADVRAQELSVKFDRNRPDGSSYGTLLSKYGFLSSKRYQSIFKDYDFETVKNNTLQKDAIKDSGCSKIGIGYYRGTTDYWVVFVV